MKLEIKTLWGSLFLAVEDVLLGLAEVFICYFHATLS
jgi:hypothetical protein